MSLVWGCFLILPFSTNNMSRANLEIQGSWRTIRYGINFPMIDYNTLKIRHLRQACVNGQRWMHGLNNSAVWIQSVKTYFSYAQWNSLPGVKTPHQSEVYQNCSLGPSLSKHNGNIMYAGPTKATTWSVINKSQVRK